MANAKKIGAGAATTALGVGVEAAVAEFSGATAVGILGAGVGAAAMPVFLIGGAVVGLAAFGLMCLFDD